MKIACFIPRPALCFCTIPLSPHPTRQSKKQSVFEKFVWIKILFYFYIHAQMHIRAHRKCQYVTNAESVPQYWTYKILSFFKTFYGLSRGPSPWGKNFIFYCKIRPRLTYSTYFVNRAMYGTGTFKKKRFLCRLHINTI
jgi:hypothetical protein